MQEKHQEVEITKTADAETIVARIQEEDVQDRGSFSQDSIVLEVHTHESWGYGELDSSRTDSAVVVEALFGDGNASGLGLARTVMNPLAIKVINWEIYQASAATAGAVRLCT